MKDPIGVVSERFAEVFGEQIESVIATAPGRVNLIGEHTDYNDGFVLPMAIDRQVAVAFLPRSDLILRAHSVAFEETREANLSDLCPPGGTEWFDYVAGVAWALRRSGLDVSGADMVIAGDVPVGAGLASSAALEIATARALCHAGSVEWDRERMARVGQMAENQYVGVNCGIMDQCASVSCEADHALLLDCRTLETTNVPIPADAAVVVMDTGVRRTLAGSEYNDRRNSCEIAVRSLVETNPTVRALRDVDLNTVAAARGSMDETTYMRAAHVVAEIDRPKQMADFLRSGDLRRAGVLMDESHASLRDLYEVSCRELDQVTDLARRHVACYGARMTGAGFGGCAVALVERDNVGDFVSEVHGAYSAASGVEGAMHVCKPAGGATIRS